MANYDNSPSRLLQRRRELTLANFRLLNPAAPLQGPAGSNEPADSSIVTSMQQGILPWIYPLANGEIITAPNVIAVALATAATASTATTAPAPAPPGTMQMTITIVAGNIMPIELGIGFISGQSITVNWGDSTTPDQWTVNQVPTHNYTTAGDYTLTINGTANALNQIIDRSQPKPKIITIVSVASWLNSLTNLANLFTNQPNNFTVPTTLPTDILDLRGMFLNAAAFDQNISSWDTATVTDMSQMFSGTTAFNQTLSGWSVAGLTSASGIFSDGANMADKSVKWPLFANRVPQLPNPSVNPTYYTAVTTEILALPS